MLSYVEIIMENKKDFKNFETYLNELKEVVEALESGKLTLDESIQKYQRGIELSNVCKKMLEEAKEVVVTKVN